MVMECYHPRAYFSYLPCQIKDPPLTRPFFHTHTLSLPPSFSSTDRKGEHRLFKVRQYCTFATANLLTVSEESENRLKKAAANPSHWMLPSNSRHAPSQVSDAVSLLLDHIYPPTHPRPLSPEDAEEEANKTPEQRQEERTNLEYQEKEVGEDLRLEATWALKRILVGASRHNRELAYQVLWAREGLLRIVRRLVQQAQATTREDKKGKSGRSLSGEDKRSQEEEKEGGKDDTGDSNSEKPPHEPQRHAGLVLALLECLDTLVSAPLPSAQSSSPSLSAVTATTTASAAVHHADGGSDCGIHYEQNYDNEDEAEVNPAPVAAAATALSTAMAQAEMRNRWAVARMLGRMLKSEGHVGGSKEGRGRVVDPDLFDDNDGAGKRGDAGIIGEFARAVLSVLAALEGKFASTSVQRRQVVLKGRIDEMMVAVREGEKQNTETN